MEHRPILPRFTPENVRSSLELLQSVADLTLIGRKVQVRSSSNFSEFSRARGLQTSAPPSTLVCHLLPRSSLYRIPNQERELSLEIHQRRAVREGGRDSLKRTAWKGKDRSPPVSTLPLLPCFFRLALPFCLLINLLTRPILFVFNVYVS